MAVVGDVERFPIFEGNGGVNAPGGQGVPEPVVNDSQLAEGHVRGAEEGGAMEGEFI